MTNTKAKIWNTTFIMKTENSRHINYHSDREILAYADEYQDFIKVERNQAPEYLYFDLYDLKEKYKNSLPDIFKVQDAVIVISQKLHDLLQNFDLGETLLFEIPLYEYNQKDRRPGTYYILHIVEKKTAFVPEASKGVVEYPVGGIWKPNIKDDILAVQNQLPRVSICGLMRI
ncbi:hypothetical protein [Parasulfitobacter algicola]|uniref:Uncharacterized protein n=1 Tax=Parasulfitobacter algicola TaxID=2614809 RepID=A0ABX2IN69_9RHOB|nr:hypothetical protein [Sulfitobacter algicola]NSX54331.1 hypothetical protein [Sulfitobacter algicola]